MRDDVLSLLLSAHRSYLVTFLEAAAEQKAAEEAKKKADEEAAAAAKKAEEEAAAEKKAEEGRRKTALDDALSIPLSTHRSHLTTPF